MNNAANTQTLAGFTSRMMKQSAGYEVIWLTAAERTKLASLLRTAGIMGRLVHGAFVYNYTVGRFAYHFADARLTRAGEVEVGA